ncbi:MAG: response regulator transcription factor [Firmicutes bacterium]|nr:response regulator transcription factor [Bacillota bacterium]
MRLFVVEDNIDLNHALVTIFKNSHYAVEFCYDGLTAIETINNNIFDCIILDIMLPKKNGIDVLKIIRNNYIDTPVLLLTAKSDVKDKILGLNTGADDYLSKPFDMEELLARTRALMRRKPSFEPDILCYHDLILNKQTHKITYKNTDLNISHKAFQIMEKLIEKCNQVVSYNQLFETIWGLETSVDIHIIWVYISHLRKILKAKDAPFEINVVRNIGYRLVVLHD